MKKRYVYSSVAAILLGVTSCQLIGREKKQETNKHQVAYIETSSTQQFSQSSGQETPEQVSAREGIAAEQIVIKITDKGYVTLHGDHYHFYSGKVPYDAIISEELIMKDPNYVFKQEDVVNEVKDGYIILVDGQYYLYLKEDGQSTNVRTKKEIDDQQQKWTGQSTASTAPSANVVVHTVAGGTTTTKRYQTSDGYVFDPTHVIDDLGDAFLVPHGSHFHYIPKKDLTPEELAAAQAYWNQKKDQPKQVGTSGVATPTPTPIQPTLPSDIPSGQQVPITPAPQAPSQTQDPGQDLLDSNDWRVLLQLLYRLPLEQRYREGDGYVFDPAQITRRLDYGVVVPHGDHFHVVLYSQLSALEQKIARLIPLVGELNHPGQVGQASQPRPQTQKPVVPKGTSTSKVVTKPTKATAVTLPKQSTKQSSQTQQTAKSIVLRFQGRTFPAVRKGLDGEPYSTSDGYVFSPASIYLVDRDGIMVQHGNHFHFVPLNELEQYELDQVAQWRKGTKPSAVLSSQSTNSSTQPSSNRNKIGRKDKGDKDKSVTSDKDKTGTNPKPTIPKQDEVAQKRAYLARETGVKEEAIELLSTPAGPAFKYPHEDHYHVVLLSMIDTTKPFDDGHGDPEEDHHAPDVPQKEGVAGIDYPTSDGFLFDGTGIVGWTDAGLLVNHNGHTHFLFKEDIAKSKWAYLLPKKGAETPSTVTLTAKQAAQRQALAASLGLPVEKILIVTVDNKVTGFQYPHEDHYDFVPVVEEDNGSVEVTEQQKRELTAYIRKAYGLLLGTPVEFKNGLAIFAIPHPHQDYDPKRDYDSDELDPNFDKGHVHPYFVPISKLKIPAQTGIPELDFENELLAAAERLGIPVGQVKIKDDKYFVLPGKDHDHYLNIFAVEGLKDYRENSLALIRPHIATGEFAKETVLAEIQRLDRSAQTLFGNDTLEYRRIRRALTQYKEELDAGARSTTSAYLEALKLFENRYLLKTEDGQPIAVNPLEERASKLIDRVNGFGDRKLAVYGTSGEALINRLKSAVVADDAAALDRVEAFLNAMKRVEDAPRATLPRVAYMDFFLRHVDSPYLPADLREKVSEKLLELHDQERSEAAFQRQLESTLELKQQVKVALASAQAQAVQPGAAYEKVNRNKIAMVGRVNHWAGIFKFAITAEEKAEGFDGQLLVLPAIQPSETPVPPSQGAPDQPAPPATPPTNPGQPEEDSGSETPTPPSTPAPIHPLESWLAGLTPQVRQAYAVDRWAAEVPAAIAANDVDRLERFTLYQKTIDRMEQEHRGLHSVMKTIYLDYFLRHIGQSYVPANLRDEVAGKALFIQTADRGEFKQLVTQLIDLKVRIQAAKAAEQTFPVETSPAYQGFLDNRAAMMEEVQDRQDYLLDAGYITAEEVADGFGQPYPFQ